MTSLNNWFQGTRPKTLGAAVAPVLVGSSLAHYENSFNLTISLLALLVSVSIQIAVNFANDYSDGIKGTDNQRIGPVRLVGQNLASPQAVKNAAFLFFFISAISGLIITILTKQWWFLLLGISAIIAAWTYTGGPKPYGYAGFGEIFVFIYFGLVAVLGTTYAQTLFFKPYFLIFAISIGLFATAILVTNNLRDREKDLQNKKITLAVKLGDSKTRVLYAALLIIPFVLVGSMFFTNNSAINTTIQIQLLALPVAWQALKPVLAKVEGKELIAVLTKTGQTELFWALLVCLALVRG
ncbi:MAG: 1,4-dihydroxy-2-naphthoate polyprenyltransferase [Actinomycetota bacterium]|nr:1,4-dihydroxy-2-naphthoate polyprenyltransferase [Actinomycetota bacterium]